MFTTTEQATHLYGSEATVGENRKRYFDANGFGDDGGYEKTWVSLKKVGPIDLGFPNSKARIRAVRIHDVHHVVAGYGTNWTGEAEIGAFELGAGCGKHYAAWILNGGTLLYGVFIAPKKVFRAFVRGRHAKSLYLDGGEWRESLLDENTGALRKQLGLDGPAPEATMADKLAFAGYWLAGALTLIAPPIAIPIIAFALWGR